MLSIELRNFYVLPIILFIKIPVKYPINLIQQSESDIYFQIITFKEELNVQRYLFKNFKFH